MSSVAVPCSVRSEERRVGEASLLAPRPTVESLPKGSRLFSTGWLPKAEPAVAEPGWVVKASRSAAAAETVKAFELTLLRPLALAVRTLPEPAVSIRRLV